MGSRIPTSVPLQLCWPRGLSMKLRHIQDNNHVSSPQSTLHSCHGKSRHAGHQQHWLVESFSRNVFVTSRRCQEDKKARVTKMCSGVSACSEVQPRSLPKWLRSPSHHCRRSGEADHGGGIALSQHSRSSLIGRFLTECGWALFGNRVAGAEIRSILDTKD